MLLIGVAMVVNKMALFVMFVDSVPWFEAYWSQFCQIRWVDCGLRVTQVYLNLDLSNLYSVAWPGGACAPPPPQIILIISFFMIFYITSTSENTPFLLICILNSCRPPPQYQISRSATAFITPSSCVQGNKIMGYLEHWTPSLSPTLAHAWAHTLFSFKLQCWCLHA